MSANLAEHTVSKTYQLLPSMEPHIAPVRNVVLPPGAVEPKGRTMPIWKRGLDLVCIAMALPVVLPAMIVISLLIKIFSRGPSFFKQERVGHHGRRFVLYKFRTMTVSSDPDVHRRHVEQLIGSGQPMSKMDAQGDARLLPLGWILRATGLDELPQLINVARGEMSLVGPRPCLPFEFERYSVPQRERFNAAPGLTGLWQVSGKNHTTFAEMVQLDIDYSRSMSLWHDLKIMLKTPLALIVQLREARTKRRPNRPTRDVGPQLRTLRPSHQIQH